MMTMFPVVKYRKVSEDARAPEKAHERGDAGFDLCAAEDATLWPGDTKLVGTGVAVAIPEGFVGLLFARSGLAMRGLALANGVGVIDPNYRGEIKAALHNHNHTGTELMRVRAGDRVCQLVIVPVASALMFEYETLDETERGERGFGSTGVRERL